MNQEISRMAKDVENENATKGEKFFHNADVMAKYDGTGNWVSVEGHIINEQTHMRKSREHFEKILTMNRLKNNEINATIKESPVYQKAKRVDWSEPSQEEVFDAVMFLSNKKSVDASGVQPEMVKAVCQDPDIFKRFYEMLIIIWRGEDPPVEWNHFLIVPLYKGKGEFADLDNWRGIALLPWTRKVLMRCMLTRLLELSSICLEAEDTSGIYKS